MIDSNNNPYGEVGSLIEGLTIADTNRILKSRPKGSVRFPKVHADSSRIVSRHKPVTPDASIHVEENNSRIIEGLFVSEEDQTQEQRQAADTLGETTLDIEILKQRVRSRKEVNIRSSVSPTDRSEKPERYIENVVAIPKDEVKKSRTNTEKLSTNVSGIMRRHLEMLMSFDDASSYVEAFARDGLSITANEVSIDDSPFTFLANFSAIEIMKTYVDKSTLSPEQKAYYMEKVMDYYLKRSEIECDTNRKSEMLRRYAGQKTEGHVVDEEGQTKIDPNQFGAVVRRK
jgi:hypothetical protein